MEMHWMIPVLSAIIVPVGLFVVAIVASILNEIF